MGAESHDHESGAQYPLEAQKTFGKGRSRKVRNTGQLTEKESQEFGAAHLDTNSVPSTSANSPDISTLLQDPPLYNKNPPPTKKILAHRKASTSTPTKIKQWPTS